MFHILYSHGATDVKFPEPAADGDWIALAIVLGCIALFAIYILIRNANAKKAEAAVVPESAPVKVAAPQKIPKAPGSAGQLKLYNVEPKTAAMIMAIVADKMGKPLNELRFISIKEID